MSEPVALPSEPEILRRLIEFRLADVHTLMPGSVLAWHPSTNTIDVQPLLKRVFVDVTGKETASSAPKLLQVPVLFPRGGGFRMTWDLAPGDIVLLLFCERSIQDWSEDGEEVDPRPRRKHDWSDAVAIPGLAPALSPIRDVQEHQAVLGAEDGSVEVRLDRATGALTVKGAQINLGGEDALLPVGRIGDAIEIDVNSPRNLGFLAWIQAVSSAGPGVVPAYSGSIFGVIAEGSQKVGAE